MPALKKYNSHFGFRPGQLRAVNFTIFRLIFCRQVASAASHRDLYAQYGQTTQPGGRLCRGAGCSCDWFANISLLEDPRPRKTRPNQDQNVYM